MSQFNPNETDTFVRETIPKGPYVARCVRVIEIGEQESKQHPEYGIKNKVVISFSLPTLLRDFKGEEKQAFISNPFGIPLSNNEKSTMAQYARALNPTASCLGDFVGCTAQLYVDEKPATKGDGMVNKIDSVSPLLPGTEVGEADTEMFWLEWDNPNGDLWSLVPEFTQTLIREAVNFRGSLMEEMINAIEGADASDLPM